MPIHPDIQGPNHFSGHYGLPGKISAYIRSREAFVNSCRFYVHCNFSRLNNFIHRP